MSDIEICKQMQTISSKADNKISGINLTKNSVKYSNLYINVIQRMLKIHFSILVRNTVV